MATGSCWRAEHGVSTLQATCSRFAGMPVVSQATVGAAAPVVAGRLLRAAAGRVIHVSIDSTWQRCGPPERVADKTGAPPNTSAPGP